jgi:hypothetical protein
VAEQVNEETNRTPVAEQANKQPWRSPPYAFRVAALAIVAACLVFFLSMLIFGDLFTNATTVIAALGSLFTLIGTIVGAYFGIKVSNDTSERSQGAIEKAHGSAMEANEKANEKTQKANERAQEANDTAQDALAALDPPVANQILEKRRGRSR